MTTTRNHTTTRISTDDLAVRELQTDDNNEFLLEHGEGNPAVQSFLQVLPFENGRLTVCINMDLWLSFDQDPDDGSWRMTAGV